MPFHQPDCVRYFTFESLQGEAVVQAVFTRVGGVSPEPWRGLNLGGTVGDAQENVAENRRRAFAAAGRPVDSLYDVWQVHGTAVIRADSPRPLHSPHLRADAILTDRPEVTLLMRFADCVPIFLFDPRHKAAGLVHAGWQGTVKRTALAAVRALQAEYGSRPEDLLAGIGPSIAAHHYTIGQEVADQVRVAFGQEASGLLPTQNGTVQFDLWEANRLVLEQAGVRQIEIAGVCTACHLEDWYSHRLERGRTGRFGALLAVSDGLR
jgi:YfiH family protein